MQTVEQLEQDIRAQVAEMGTWEDPYVEFYKRGVTGQKGEATYCVVARYLNAKLDGAEIEVDGWHAQGTIGLDYTSDVELPEKVNQFISDFDAGKYPELVTADTD